MGQSSRPALAPADDTYRVTAFEVFFDLVFVFAFTRITSFMIHDLTPLTLYQGLLLLLLMWWAWSAYSWLGNQARVDVGRPLAAAIVAMAAIFIVGLLVPHAWHEAHSGLYGPVALAVAYCVVRLLYVVTYRYASSGDQRLRGALVRSNVNTFVALVPFLAGAVMGGRAQVVLWTLTFVIDFGGGALTSTRGGWRVRSARYFAERHGLIVIIALGESITSVGAGVGTGPITAPSVLAALLGLALTIALWLLYFRVVAPRAERRLVELRDDARAKLARDAYTLLHFVLIAGVIYLAVGIEQVLARLSTGESGVPARPLGVIALVALGGGIGLFLVGLAAIARRAARS